MCKHKYTPEEQRLLDDLFLRGVRANPRDMTLAVEQFGLLEQLVELVPRLDAIIDRVLLLRIALLRSLLSEKFDDLEKEPGLLRDWELGIDRPSFPKEDKEGPRLLGEILRPVHSAKCGGSFAELEDVDLLLYTSMATHDAERAISGLKAGMIDVADEIEIISDQLQDVDPDSEPYTQSDANLFEQLINRHRRAINLRYDLPAKVSTFIVAMIELAVSDDKDKLRVEKFFNYIKKEYDQEVFLIRWEIVARVTTLDTSKKLIDLVRTRASSIDGRDSDSATTARGKLLEKTVEVEGSQIGIPNLVKISASPVTNDEYEMFDPGHAVLRHEKGAEGWSDVSSVSLIEAALFCEWLNQSNDVGGNGPWAFLPTLTDWQTAIEAMLSGNGVKDVAKHVWEWTVSSLDADSDADSGDVLRGRAFPHVWLCGGSWYQQWVDEVAAEKAVKQQLWFPPMHHRPDVGFRIFWYKKDRYKNVCSATQGQNGNGPNSNNEGG